MTKKFKKFEDDVSVKEIGKESVTLGMMSGTSRDLAQTQTVGIEGQFEYGLHTEHRIGCVMDTKHQSESET